VNTTAIQQLVLLCAAKGIEHAVLCPGSRSAPLTLGFLRSNQLTCYTFSDERSASFVALGIAQQSRKPVALVCTSGSAAYNFAPAVAEAFFQQVPLVVLTADRPAEWIDQLDGQTIRQPGLYGDHVKQSYSFPQEFGHEDAFWLANRTVNEAINLAAKFPQGPVHINTPFREPLYPESVSTAPNKTPRTIQPETPRSELTEETWRVLLESIQKYSNVLVVSGQRKSSPDLDQALSALHALQGWPIAGDILSNLHGRTFFIRHSDTFLGQLSEKTKASLKPDLLITCGGALVAKNLKLYLRGYRPHEHWHVQPGGYTADTFQSLTRTLPIEPAAFFAQLTDRLTVVMPSQRAFGDVWLRHENSARSAIKRFFESNQLGEFALVNRVLESLPDRCNLHLANSMSVRYANHIGLTDQQAGVQVFSNRGTSGIDGCSSTAVGHALTSPLPNVLITGDQAFFYDRNAFWHNYPLPNLHVVVINNHGGIIFNLIDGPSRQPEAEEYFITRQTLRASNLAAEFGFIYSEGQSPSWKEFFQPGSAAKIHELESSQTLNKTAFESFKSHLRKNHEAH
jgi:2-succinyl-5-enolpyruvyl-6-hydroxy-3-cyclohexene-1-carboxylate synthase